MAAMIPFVFVGGVLGAVLTGFGWLSILAAPLFASLSVVGLALWRLAVESN